ncbi:hypothetical protein JOC78_003404 [Bacillus ectoiniformans]|uniref:hypothetical protein n=1 Tax=Bacillus ectoiniformans TaxID=1494429 RepID=UPI00195994D2|nr:hypothetical protein [Bacillus ectoiniformans]MBM7650414.1 hypothetical protein [Bacillus ectoiniformans]
MKDSHSGRRENQVYSSRVLRSEFDKNWRTMLSPSGNVIYVATADRAEVIVLLSDGTSKLLIFPKNGEIIVGGGGTSHYSKPHIAKTL